MKRNSWLRSPIVASPVFLAKMLWVAIAAILMRALEHPLWSALLPKPMLGVNSVGGADATTLAADLKQFYLPGYNNQLQNSTYLLDRLSRNTPETVGGSAVYMFAVNKRHSGGARAPRAPLPTAGSTGGFNPTSTTSKIFMPIAWEGDILDKAKNDRDAYVKALDLEMETAQDDGRVLLNHYLWLPKTAIRARIAGTPSAGVITVDNDGLVNNADGGRLAYVLPNYYIDTVSSSTGLVTQAGLLVAATNTAAGTNSISTTLNGVASAGAAADNDYIVLGDMAGGANDYNQGVSGLTSALSTTDNIYWGIDRSVGANAVWRPQRFNAAGYDFTDANPQRVNIWRGPIDRIKKFGGNPDGRMIEGQAEDVAILTSVEGMSLFGATLTAQQRFVNTTHLEGGWRTLLCHGVPMVEDPDCPLGLYFYIRWADYQLYSELGKVGMSIEDRDGQTVRWLTGYDMWIMIMRARMELGCKTPNRQAVMYNVPMTAIGPS